MRLRYLIPIVIICLAIIFGLLWKYNINMDVVTGFILSVTMLVVIVYTRETHRMRNEMIKQTELRMRPLITVDFDKKDRKCFIENVGYGAAINIQIIDIKTSDEKSGKGVRFVFDTVSAMMSQGKEMIENYEAYLSDGTKLTDMSEPSRKLGLYVEKKRIIFKIFYENLIAIEYSSKVQCGKEGCRILEIK
ncbi:MAG: hypothetical protein ACETWM_13790 [Candidatus Lokiarchaeia archaeon]